MGLELLKEIIMEEVGLISVLKRSYVWVIHTSSTRVCIVWSGGNEHDRSGDGEERYAALGGVCVRSKRNETRPLGSSGVNDEL